MSLKIGLIGVLGAAILAYSAPAFASPQTVPARIASACNVGSGEGYGYAYLTSLSVERTSCATGKSLVRHKGKLPGWHCSRKVLDRSPVQYDARESCSSGDRRVTYGFTENT
jgi:hypothetical protein